MFAIIKKLEPCHPSNKLVFPAFFHSLTGQQTISMSSTRKVTRALIMKKIYHAACVILLSFCAGSSLYGQDLARLSKTFLEQQASGLAGDIEIVMGELDPRNKLAPCQGFEPFLPNGFKLWGKTMLGIRCVEGATWSTYLPVQIKVHAPVLLAARPIQVGQTLSADDYRTERMEVTQWSPGALISAEQLSGKVAQRTILPNQALRRDMFRAQAVISSGDAVKIIMNGKGFVVSSEGKALTQGADGDTVQIVTRFGRSISGTARPGKVVEIKL